MASTTEEVFCRICYSETNPVTKKKDLISPCNCSGSVKYVHYTCLKLWRMKGKAFGDIRKCEQCLGVYTIPGERPIHSFIVSLLSVISMVLMYFLSMLVFKDLFEALGILWNEADFPVLFDLDAKYYQCSLAILIFLYDLFVLPRLRALTAYVLVFSLFFICDHILLRILFFTMSAYMAYDIYKSFYETIDGMYYYVMNVGWYEKCFKEAT